MKVEINYSKKMGGKHKHMEAKPHATKKPIKKSKRKSEKKTLRQMKIKTQLFKIITKAFPEESLQ